MRLRTILSLTLPFAAVSPAVPASADSPQAVLATSIEALRKHEERVTIIGERLSAAAAAAGWCDPVPSLGWTLGDVASYPKSLRPLVRRHWQLPNTTTLFVSSIAPDGTAAQAGVTAGMGIASIDGQVPVRYQGSTPTRRPLDVSEGIVEAALGRGPVAVETVGSDGTTRRFELTGRPVCRSRFEVSAEDEEQAYADGSIVQVTAGMAEYTKDSDDQLAGVIAHEIAHNVLRHIPRQSEAGTPDDYRRHLRRYANLSRDMEEEADRLAVWLLMRAGYDPEAPLAFWTRFGPNNDSAHPFGRLHDPWRDRVAAIQDELALMRREKEANPDARPALLDRARPVTPAAIPANR
jgi:beta-barrel assembly-enhancing protease